MIVQLVPENGMERDNKVLMDFAGHGFCVLRNEYPIGICLTFSRWNKALSYARVPLIWFTQMKILNDLCVLVDRLYHS